MWGLLRYLVSPGGVQRGSGASPAIPRLNLNAGRPRLSTPVFRLRGTAAVYSRPGSHLQTWKPDLAQLKSEAYLDLFPRQYQPTDRFAASWVPTR